MFKSIRRLTNGPLLPLLGVMFLAWGCGEQNQSGETVKKPSDEVKPTVIVPKPAEQYEGTPYWEAQSRKWPAVQEWSLTADGEYTQDSLLIRMSGKVIQSFISGPKGKKHPLMCSIELTVRPVPFRLAGRTFIVDSVVFYDPIKKRILPKLPMLSFERHTEKGTVRTEFTNDIGFSPSPDLEENQPLEPRVYVTTVSGKIAMVHMAPINVSFIREIKPQITPMDSLKWGPT